MKKLSESTKQSGVSVQPKGRSRSKSIQVVAVIVLILGLLSAILGFSIGIRLSAWQYYLVACAALALTGMSAAAIVLCRRNKESIAAWLLVGGISVFFLIIAIFLENLGLLFGMTAIAVIISIALLTLPPRWENWGIFTGLIVGVVAGLLDFAALPFQFPAYRLEQLLPFITFTTVLFFGAFVVWQFRNLGLTSKLLISFFVVTFLVAGVITFATINATRNALTASVGNGLYSVTGTQARAVGDMVQGQIDALTALSMNDTMQSQIRSSNFSYSGKLGTFQTDMGQLDETWKAAAEQNDELDPLIWSRLHNQVASELKEYQTRFPNNVEIFITDRYGAELAATNMTSDYYQGDEGWWQSAISTGQGKTYISPPEYDESVGQMSILMAIPVRDSDSGSVIGVLRTTYLLSSLSEMMQVVDVGETGSVDMYFPGETAMLLHDGSLVDATQEIKDLLKNMVASAYGEFSISDSPSLVSQAPVRSSTGNPDIAELGWQVVAYQNIDEALAPVAVQTRRILLLSVVIVGIVSGGAVLLAQLIGGPINRLTVVAAQIGAGELTAVAKIESADEVGRLAATFNEMTARLRQILESLEQSVAERTRELSLSGEVGRTLSQEHDLDKLLADAVELIQSTFSLYYTQIYLMDVHKPELHLRAGSGDAGTELMRRGHKLLIGATSINGTAAASKKPVIVPDTSSSETFKSNPLLPETRSEMSVPLLVGDRVVGVLDMQSSQGGAFSEDNLPAFQALAGQLAISIENASLFLQAQQARIDLEDRARRLTREGWQEFLDAIERSERIGYLYKDADVAPLSEPLSPMQAENILASPIQITGEEVGTIQLIRQSGSEWIEPEVELVSAVASQVARQVDNLRLLAQAESYRSKAEMSARRLTRQGWEEFIAAQGNVDVGFVYNQTQVLPESPDLDESLPMISQTLQVHGEPIGEFRFEGESAISNEDQQLINVVTERLSTHIENLRLSAQTRIALLETETLYNIIAEMSAAGSFNDILNALTGRTLLHQADQLLIMGVFDHPLGSGKTPEWIYPVAYRSDARIEIASRYPMSAFEAKSGTLFTEKPTVIPHLGDDRRVDRVSRTLFKQVFKAESSIIIPLRLGEQTIGFIQGYYSQPTEFPDNEVQRLIAVASQAAIAVQSRLLLEQTQAHARQEQRIREVTSSVYEAVDIDTIMRRAVEQVGRVLGVPAFIYLGDGDGQVQQPVKESLP